MVLFPSFTWEVHETVSSSGIRFTFFGDLSGRYRFYSVTDQYNHAVTVIDGAFWPDP